MQNNYICFWFCFFWFVFFFPVRSIPLSLRNFWLRIYISNLKKQEIRRISHFYHFCVNKFYDFHLSYYSLTEKEQEFLENVIWLLF